MLVEFYPAYQNSIKLKGCLRAVFEIEVLKMYMTTAGFQQ